MNDVTLEMIDGHPTLRFRRRVSARLAEVWRAVSEPGVIGEWFLPMHPFTITTELEELLGQSQGGPVSSEPGSRVTWVKEDLEVTFRLAEAAGAVDVELLVTLGDRDEAAVAAMTFDPFLDRLAPFLAGEKLAYGAVGDLDEQARLLEGYAIRLGIDPEPGRAWVANKREALAAVDDEAEDDSTYQRDPDAADRLEAAMLPYLREHAVELTAAEARRGMELDPRLLDEWLLPSVQDTSEYVERFTFLMDRFIGDKSMSLADVESAWRATHPQ